MKSKVFSPNALFILTIFADFLPVPFAFLFYRGGWAGDLANFSCIILPILFLNYKVSNKTIKLAVLTVLTLAATLLSGRISTQLYYKNVSSDYMSLVVGDIITAIEVGLVLLISVVSIIAKAISARKADLSVQD